MLGQQSCAESEENCSVTVRPDPFLSGLFCLIRIKSFCGRVVSGYETCVDGELIDLF